MVPHLNMVIGADKKVLVSNLTATKSKNIGHMFGPLQRIRPTLVEVHQDTI